MSFVAMFIFTMALFPGVFPSLNLGVLYLTPIRLGLLLLPVMLVNKYNRRRDYRCVNLFYSYNRFYITFTVLWFFYSIVTVFWVKSISDWAHAEYFLGLFVYCTIFLTVGDLKRNDFINIFKWLCFIILIHNVIGWYEIFSHHYLFAPAYKVDYMAARSEYYAISAFGNLNDFAFVMMFGSFISYLSYNNSRKRIGKIVSFATMASCILHVIRSDSRSCILALFLGWCVYLLVTLKKRTSVKLFFIITGMLSSMALILPEFFFRVTGVLSAKLNFNFQSAELNSDIIRVNLIKNGFGFLKRTNLFGVGSGNTEAWMTTQRIYDTGEITNMHNWWMENLTNYGVVIFILYLIFYLSLIITFYRGLKVLHGKSKKMSAVIVSILSAFIIGLMSSSSFFSTEWLWVFFALLIALQRIERLEYKQARGEI